LKDVNIGLTYVLVGREFRKEDRGKRKIGDVQVGVFFGHPKF